MEKSLSPQRPKRVSEKPSKCQSGEQQPDHGQVDPRFFRAWQRLVVLAQPPVATQPGEGELDHPAAGQHLAVVTRGCTPDSGPVL